MPSGYTAAVQDGKITEFNDFAMSCARAMGALIMMRDMPSSAPIPERFEPSTDYHDKSIKEAKARLDELGKMSNAEVREAAQKDHDEALASAAAYEAKKDEQRERYAAMLKKVRAWQPPTDDHVGFKEFMVEQLTSSIKWDCSYSPERPKKLSPADWLEAEVKSAERDLTYHAEERAKEIERTEARNRWVAELRASLKIEENV